MLLPKRLPRRTRANSGQRYMQPPRKYRLVVMMDANARTGRREINCGVEEAKVLGAYDAMCLSDNMERLLHFFGSLNLAPANTFLSAPKKEVSYTIQGPKPDQRWCLDFLIVYQSVRPYVCNVA